MAQRFDANVFCFYVLRIELECFVAILRARGVVFKLLLNYCAVYKSLYTRINGFFSFLLVEAPAK